MTENQHINILKDIESFKAEIHEKYGVDIYLFIKEMGDRLSLKVLEKMCIATLYEQYPSFINTKSLKNKSRLRPVTMFRQIFFYLAITKYGYRKTEASKYMKRNHATSIHSIKVCEDYMYIGYSEFNRCLESVQNKIEQHVGNISENNKGEDNSKSNASIVQREREDISTITEV